MKAKQFLLLLALVGLIQSCSKKVYYDSMTQFGDGYARIKSFDKQGVMDTTGEWVIAPIFDSILDAGSGRYVFRQQIFALQQDSLFIVDIGNQNQITKPNQKQFYPNFLLDLSFKVGSTRVRTSDTIYPSNQHNWGALTIENDTIVPFVYDQIIPGIATDLVATKGVRGALRTFLYDSNGNVICETFNVPIQPWNHLGYYWLNYQIGRVDLRRIVKDTFELIQEFPFDEVQVAGENCWVRKTGRWHLFSAGFDLSTETYDSVQMNAHWGVVAKNGLWALVDRNGLLMSEFIYHGPHSYYISSSPFVIARSETGWKLVDSKGKVQKEFLSKEMERKRKKFALGFSL